MIQEYKDGVCTDAQYLDGIDAFYQERKASAWLKSQSKMQRSRAAGSSDAAAASSDAAAAAL